MDECSDDDLMDEGNDDATSKEPTDSSCLPIHPFRRKTISRRLDKLVVSMAALSMTTLVSSTTKEVPLSVHRPCQRGRWLRGGF
jgi:hypothetical protein